jgi:hypothetical protein
MIANGAKVYNSFDEELMQNWEVLYSKGGIYNLSPEWCKIWVETFEKEKSLYIYTFWENKVLKVVAPLYLKGNRLSLIGTKPDIYDEFNVLYENPKYLDKFVDFLAAEPYDLNFKHLNSSSDFAKKLVKKFSSVGIPTVSQVTETKNRICEKINQESSIRSDIKRCEKNLLKDLNEEYVFEFSPVKKQEFIDEFIKFHIDRWNGGMMVKKKNLAKFTEKIYFGDKNMSLARLYMKNSGETVAYCYGYVDSKNEYWLSMTAHDAKFRKYAGGKVILLKLIDYLKERGISKFDFGRGAENYKSEFSDYEDVLFNFFTYKTTRKYIKVRNFIDKVLKLVYNAR